MNEKQLDYFKRAIKRNYKRYTKERTDAEATLTDVTKFFNIPIDENRIKDYTIENINFKIPSIEVFDTKENTTYKAEYTACASLLGYYTDSEEYRYINLISDGPKGRVESLCYFGVEKPIISEATIQSDNGEYELIIQKQRPNIISVNSSDGDCLKIRYLQNSKQGNKKTKNTLLGKKITRFIKGQGHYSCDSFLYSSLFVYGDKPMFLSQMCDLQNNYTYTTEQGIIYGINELMLKPEGAENKDVDLQGVCCENTQNIDGFVSEDFKPDRLKKLGVSVLVFNGGSDFTGDRDELKHHVLEIGKTEENIIVNYKCIRGVYSIHVIERDDHHTLQISTDGKISAYELDEISQLLCEKYSSDKFIDAVISEVKNFKDKINIRDGLVEEDVDLLAPKLLIDKSIGEICSMISSNKEEYFKLMEDQFYDATHISEVNKSKKVYTRTATVVSKPTSN